MKKTKTMDKDEFLKCWTSFNRLTSAIIWH